MRPRPCPNGRVRNAHSIEQGNDTLVYRATPELGVAANGLRNLLADFEYRVQAGHRFLEYHRDFAAPNLTKSHRRCGEKLLAT
jgi:hypothetical protein